MKLDINSEYLEDIKNVELFLDTFNITKLDSNGNNYSSFIRLGFLVKHFEHEIWNLKNENKSLKDSNKELKQNIKLLKKDIKNGL